jgi:hypothetical protein
LVVSEAAVIVRSDTASVVGACFVGARIPIVAVCCFDAAVWQSRELARVACAHIERAFVVITAVTVTCAAAVYGIVCAAVVHALVGRADVTIVACCVHGATVPIRLELANVA